MCIAIVKKAGKVLDKSTLEVCFDANPDGAGFAYVNTDINGIKRLKIYKTLDFEKFWVKYEKAQNLHPDSNFLIHFRIKTHGAIDVTNCHPFSINKNECFIHNGIISGLPSSKTESDTIMFNKHVLKQLDKGWHENEGVKKLIESFIGASKIIHLTVDNKFVIFNENKGSWVDDVWYSNDSYKKRTYVFSRNVPSRVVKNYKIVGFDTKECDFCGDNLQLRDMSFYSNGQETKTICKGCEAYVVSHKMVNKSHKIRLSDYLNQVNKEENSGFSSYYDSLYRDNDYGVPF